MSIGDIRELLHGITSENSHLVYEEVVNQCDESLLCLDDIPNEYFNFFVKILSSESLISKKGSHKIIGYLYDDFDKLSPNQQLQLPKILMGSYSIDLYEDYRLRVCDFIARKYSHDMAFKWFSELSDATNLNGDVGTLVGLDVLLRYSDQESSFGKKVRKLYRKIEGSTRSDSVD